MIISSLEKEKDKIVKNIIDILEIKDNEFSLYELDNNIIKQNKLMELKPEIEKLYKKKELTFLQLNKKEYTRPYLCLIKSILKERKYSIIIQKGNLKMDDGTRKGFQKYIILPPNQDYSI